MDLIILSIILAMAITLIVLIIKEHMAYKKEFNDSSQREYNARLKNEFETSEE